MRRALPFAFFAVALGCLAPTSAWCDDAKPDDQPSPRREVPNYDGRGPPPDGTNAGVWIARVLFSPLYLVSEYVIREPLDALFGFLEKNDRLDRIYDFFAFGPDHKLGFAPIGFVEFGFLPSVGVYGFWNDALFTGNSVHMHIEVWPTDWLAATFTDRYAWGSDHSVELRASGVNRPDQVFYGVGPRSAQWAQSRYREARTDVAATLDLHVWRSSRFRAWGGIRKVDTSDGHYGSDPSLSQEARTGVFAEPFGFNRDYVDPYVGAHLTFDTRKLEDPRSGVRLEAMGDLGTDLEHGSSGWAHYAGAAHAWLDLDGYRRIVSLHGSASFVDPLGSDPIPFTELVSLGGDKWMTGYFPGRLRGQSSVAAMLRYDWPIASWIDGTIQAVVGNVFDERLSGFDLGALRFSGAIGFTTTTEVIASFAGAGATQGQNAPARVTPPSPRIEFIAGFGTDTFDHGATIQSFHVSFGVPHSF